MKDQLSNCCKAQVIVSSSDEGTSCFVCSECKEACDLTSLYHFYITYSFIMNHWLLNGSCSLKRTKPIRNMDDINQIADWLQSERNISQVIILNWREF